MTTGSNSNVNSFGVGTSASGVAGELRAAGQISAYYSDRRLKMNIEEIDNALQKIENIRGVYYNQNDVAERLGYQDYSRQVGVIAQEIQKILPEAIKPAPFDLDTNGVSKSGENYLTVQYEKIIPLLIECIKELKRRTD